MVGRHLLSFGLWDVMECTVLEHWFHKCGAPVDPYFIYTKIWNDGWYFKMEGIMGTWDIGRSKIQACLVFFIFTESYRICLNEHRWEKSSSQIQFELWICLRPFLIQLRPNKFSKLVVSFFIDMGRFSYKLINLKGFFHVGFWNFRKINVQPSYFNWDTGNHLTNA